MIILFCLGKLVELHQLWITCDPNVSQTHGKDSEALNVFADICCTELHSQVSECTAWFLLSLTCKQIYLVKCTKKKFYPQKNQHGMGHCSSIHHFSWWSVQKALSTFILADFFLFSFLSLCLVFCGVVLFMSYHLHVPAVKICTTYNKWRFHNIKCVEAVLVVLSMIVCRKDTGNCEQRLNRKE